MSVRVYIMAAMTWKLWSNVHHLSPLSQVWIWLYFYLLVQCFFFRSLFAHILFFFFWLFVCVSCFKWENKWIIISRPPERPISCALGSAVHFTVRIFYETVNAVVGLFCVGCCSFRPLRFRHFFGFGLFWLFSFFWCAFFFSLLKLIPIGLFAAKIKALLSNKQRIKNENSSK